MSMTRGIGLALAATTLAGTLAASPLVAQRFRRGYGYQAPPPEIDSVAYNGRFTFARLSYVTRSPGGYYYQGLPAWAHGYPDAEHNLVQILNALSFVKPMLDETKVVAIDDPTLFKYPVAYMTEAGWWVLQDKEIPALRKYLEDGGFVIFDDFREDYRMGNDGWENFANNMEKILPGVQFFDLTPQSPIFHSFYEINSLSIIPQYYDQGAPVLKAIYQDNDPTKRMLAVINFNTDVSNYWQFSAEGFRPISESNEAYKLGVNYIIYALSH
jgi:Domain of unknown function (DUF4159)